MDGGSIPISPDTLHLGPKDPAGNARLVGLIGNFDPYNQWLAMRIFTLLLAVMFSVGCDDHDESALLGYFKVQNMRFEQYEHGNVEEAKQALNAIITEARSRRGTIGGYYGTEKDAGLAYGKLALIAEHQGEAATARDMWARATDAYLEGAKAERVWAKSNPNVYLPAGDYDDGRNRSHAQLRAFILKLEEGRRIAWQCEDCRMANH